MQSDSMIQDQMSLLQSPPILPLLLRVQYFNQGVVIQNILAKIFQWGTRNKTLFYEKVMPSVFHHTELELNELLNFAHRTKWKYVDEKHKKSRPYNHHDIKHRFLRVFLHIHGNGKSDILKCIRKQCSSNDEKYTCIRQVYENEIQNSKTGQYADEFDIPWMQQFINHKQLMINLYNEVQRLDQKDLSYLIFWSSEWQAQRDFWTQTNDYVCGPAFVLMHCTPISVHNSHEFQVHTFISSEKDQFKLEKGNIFESLNMLSEEDFSTIVQKICTVGFGAFKNQQNRRINLSIDEKACYDLIREDMTDKMQQKSDRYLETHPDITYRPDPFLTPNCGYFNNRILKISVTSTAGRGNEANAKNAHAAEHGNGGGVSREQKNAQAEQAREDQEKYDDGQQHHQMRHAHSKYASKKDSYSPAYTSKSTDHLESVPKPPQPSYGEHLKSKQQNNEWLKLNIKNLIETCNSDIKSLKDNIEKTTKKINTVIRLYDFVYDPLYKDFIWTDKMSSSNLKNSSVYKDLYKLYRNNRISPLLSHYAIEFELLEKNRNTVIAAFMLRADYETELAALNIRLEKLEYFKKNQKHMPPQSSKFAEKIKQSVDLLTRKYRSKYVTEFIKCGQKSIEKIMETDLSTLKYDNDLWRDLTKKELPDIETQVEKLNQDKQKLNPPADKRIRNMGDLQKQYDELQGRISYTYQHTLLTLLGFRLIVQTREQGINLGVTEEMVGFANSSINEKLYETQKKLIDFQHVCNSYFDEHKQPFFELSNAVDQIKLIAKETKQFYKLYTKKMSKISKDSLDIYNNAMTYSISDYDAEHNKTKDKWKTLLDNRDKLLNKDLKSAWEPIKTSKQEITNELLKYFNSTIEIKKGKERENIFIWEAPEFSYEYTQVNSALGVPNLKVHAEKILIEIVRDISSTLYQMDSTKQLIDVYKNAMKRLPGTYTEMLTVSDRLWDYKNQLRDVDIKIQDVNKLVRDWKSQEQSQSELLEYCSYLKNNEPTLVKTLGLLYYQQEQQRFQDKKNPVVKNNSDRSTLSDNWADQIEDMKDLTMQEAIEKYYAQFEAQKKKNKSTLSFISMLDFTYKNKIIDKTISYMLSMYTGLPVTSFHAYENHIFYEFMEVPTKDEDGNLLEWSEEYPNNNVMTKSYRNMTLKLHPDKIQQNEKKKAAAEAKVTAVIRDKGAEMGFQDDEMNEALFPFKFLLKVWSILKNDDIRKAYSLYGDSDYKNHLNQAQKQIIHEAHKFDPFVFMSNVFKSSNPFFLFFDPI